MRGEEKGTHLSIVLGHASQGCYRQEQVEHYLPGQKLKFSDFCCQGANAEKHTLWVEWFSAVQDKNSTIRRETELSFK